MPDDEVQLTIRRRSKFMGDMEDVEVAGRVSSVDELRGWLNEDTNIRPDGTKRRSDISERPRRWDLQDGRGDSLPFVLHAVEVGGGFEIHVSERWQGVAWVLRGRIGGLEVVRVECEHDWTEWRYDTMGGDNRDCRRCGRTEFT